ncbi:MAG: endonuclease/exonuclease/phosphatase family protein [Clostridia bacterium]|nr:endonuclease/exonuclease/phosphatase family protein [Clostridia bacterium]
MKIRLMSFNVLHCEVWKRKCIDFDAFAAAILDSGADIIGLNEVRGQGERDDYQAQAKILAEKTGFHYYFAKAIDVGGKNPYGNALLSRFPIKNAQTVMIPDPVVRIGSWFETRCLLKAELDVADGLTVLVTHFGLNKSEQKNAVKTVVENFGAQKLILMGDFNVHPDDKVLLPIREQLKDTADLFNSPLCSFPSDAPDRKIDYIFVSPGVKILNADIPAWVLSDHRPHTAEVEIE